MVNTKKLSEGGNGKITAENYKGYVKVIMFIAATALFLGIVGTFVLTIMAPEWATVLYAMAQVGAALAIWIAIDKYALKKYDTFHEIFVRKNVAFAVVLGSILIAVAIIISK
jgi:hypothetical protein